MYQIKREMTINLHVFKIQNLSACIALHLYITYLTTSITCTYKIHIIECIKIDIFIGESVMP